MKHFMVQKEIAPKKSYAKGTRDKELGVLSTVGWETKMANCKKYVARKFQASSIGIWLIPGQM